MADRTVKVVLKADVSAYVRDVAVAAAATRELRHEAERFAGRYNAVLRVNTTGAVRDMKAADQSMSRSAANMSKSFDAAGRKLEDRMRLFRGQIDDLKKFGADDLLNIDSRKIRGEIRGVKSELASLLSQRSSFEVASNIADARADIARLVGELNRLDHATYEPTIKLQTKTLVDQLRAAQRDLVDSGPGAFAERLRKQVEGAFRSLPALEIDADATPAEREIAAIRAELAALGDKRIGVDIDDKSFMAQAAALQMRLRALAASSTSVRFQADAGDAARQLDNLGGSADNTGRKIANASRENDKFNKGLLHTVRIAATTSQALGTLAIPPALLGATPAVSSLGASLLQVGSAATLLPGLLAGAGVGLSAILIGLKDWADVVEQLGKGKLDKASVQAQELSTEARKTAMSLIDLAKAYDTAAESVQDELFRGTSDELRQLADVYLPIITKDLAGVARQINIAAVAFSDFATRAETVKDAKDGIENVRIATQSLAPVIVNLSTIFRDMSAVGARELPSLAQNFEAMTARWQESIQRARANGDLARWIAEGRAEVNQLGRVFGNTGSIMIDFFRAGEAAGIDTLGTLERLTARARDYMNSWQGQAQVREFLAGMKADASAFLPGLKALAGAALDFVQHLSGSGTLKAVGDAFSALAISARPLIEILSQLTSAVLRPLLGVITAIAPALGPALVGLYAFRTAASAVGSAQKMLVGGTTAAGVATSGLAGRFDKAAQAASGGAVATSRMSGVLSKASGMMPGVAAAIIGVAIGYEALRSRADEAASSILSGSATIQGGIDQQTAALERQQIGLGAALNGVLSLVPGLGLAKTAWELFGGSEDEATVAANNQATARRQVYEQLSQQIAIMPPLQAATATATLRQAELSAAVGQFGIHSSEARFAAGALAYATEQVEIQQLAARLGVDQNTAALTRQRDVMLGVADAELGYASAKTRTTESIAQNGRTLDLNTTQGQNNTRALLDMVRAAGADLEAKEKQKVSTGELSQRTAEHRQQLIDTAIRMGMSRDRAAEYVDQLLRVPPSIATQVHIDGLVAAIHDVDTLRNSMRELNGGTDPRIDTRSLNNNRIRPHASGGAISGPGTGTSDSVLMWGSNGEWVIRDAVVQDQGQRKMDALNSGKADIVPRYRDGGRVGRGGLPAYAGGGQIAGYAGGGAVGGGGGGGLIGQAIAQLNELRGVVANTWAAVNRDTSAGFSGLAATIGARMGEIVAVASGGATQVANVVSGQFGRVSVDANVHFGAAALTVGTRMTGAKDVAVGQAGALGAGVGAAFGATALNTEAQFGAVQGSIGARMAGARGTAVAEAGVLQGGVGTAFAGTAANTDVQFGAVQSFVGSRMAGARALGTSEGSLLQTGLAGSWGAAALNTDQQFGAVQGTIGTRMIGAQVAGNTEGRNLQTGLAGTWGATALSTDQHFSGMRDTVSNRMLVTKDDANRKAGETDVGVTGAFRSMDGSANTIWSGMMGNAARKFSELKGAVGGPVHWVVDLAWNVGARGLWDAAGRIFPLGPFPAAVARFATGGPVYGPGTGTSDSIPAMLSTQEHVWTKREVDGAGGHGEVAQLRAMARSGDLARFADGGAWRGMFGRVKQQFPSATLNSAYRPGDPGYHGKGQAIDIGGPMMAINRWIAQAMPDKTELIHTPGINLLNNRPHTYNAATRADHWDHVHWATGGANAGVNGSAQGSVVSMLDMLMGAITGPTNALRGMIGQRWPKNGTMSGDLPSHAGEWMINGITGVLRKKAEEMDAAMAASFGGGSAAISGPIMTMLQQTAAQFGWGGGPAWGDLVQLVQHESHGDPNAQNPGSTAYGIGQFLNSTWASTGIAKTSNPALQILAMMRYIRGTYGNPSNAWHSWLGRSPHWYHEGGTVPGTGDKTVMAEAGERVLTRGQNITFERMVSVLDKPQPMPAAFRGRVAGGDGSSTQVDIHNENHFREAVDLDLFNQRQDFAVRSLTF